MTEIEIPMKLPSLNDYINVCRRNRYEAANFKRHIEKDIGTYLQPLPRYEGPVIIEFVWTEKDHRRDLDNICFAKKFILDALVKCGKLRDDNRKCVMAFTDSFRTGKETKVNLRIKEYEIERDI